MEPQLQGAELRLASPRGFCAGVERAIEIVERAVEIFGVPIYVRHEVVHNRFVVDELRNKGVVFVDELDEVPDSAVVIFSAHGVPQSVRRQAQERGLRVFDATCPLVTKVHLEVARYERENHECVLIGHAGHPEVEGTMGQYLANDSRQMYLVENVEDVSLLAVNDPEHLAFVTQTTLSIDDTAEIIEALKSRFPAIEGPRKDDICYATQNRQDAVKALAVCSDLILVVGSRNSSNSNRLCELPRRLGVSAYLIDQASEIDPAWLIDCQRIGVTAGASVPEVLVAAVIDQLLAWGATLVDDLAGEEEEIVFSLPKALQKTSA